jgi:Pro-kumamolisin, activation domain/Bacterial Ig-like domain (group 3)/MBG domain (YGX type)/FG-GAP-like repeat
VRVARRVVSLLLFVVFLCRLYRRGSNCLVRLTALALTLCTGLSSMCAQEVRPQVMHHHVRQEVTDRRAALMGRLPGDTQMHLSVILPLRNQAALNGLLQRLYDRSSPDYHHFLTVAQFTEQFGPTEDDYAAVAAYLRSYGLKVEDAPANRLIVPLNGSAAKVNAAFNLQMNTYQHPTENRTFFSPDREPSMRLDVPVWHIAGLDNFSIPRHFMHHRMAGQAVPLAVNGSGPGNSYLGSDMRAAYYGGTTLDGTGQAVGLLEYGGYDMTDVTLTFSNAGQTTNVPVNNVLLDGSTGGPEGPYGDGEQVLDIVQAIGMAPGLSQVRVYIGQGQDDAHMLNSMASENIAKQLSCSWGWLPADPAADDVFFEEMAVQGQSFFAASGDNGAFDAAISPYFYPAEDKYVTTVGGTHLTTSGPGGTWVSETAWNSGGAGTGGGISPDGIPLPSYQSGLVTIANGGSATLRNEPDVAMEADFDNYSCQAHGCSGGWAGTSFAAPRWAGFMAMVNQQAVEAGTAPSGGIGFLNPPLYVLAQGPNAGSDLHDIVAGNNRTENQPVWFSAVAGYDLTTGWGSASGQSLIDDLAGPQVPGFWLTSLQSRLQLPVGGTSTTTIKITDAGGFTGGVNLAVTSALPSGVTASFGSNPTTGSDVLTFSADSSVVQQDLPVTVTGTSGSLTQSTNMTLSIHTPTFALVPSSSGFTLNQGNTVTATITVIPEYGFTGSVNLSIAGLPSGVTASFSPTSTTGTSTMTLTASASAPGGTNTLTVTGTSGSITATTTLKLAITGPQFALYAGSPVTVGQGSSASVYVEVNPENGFSGSVTLAATNLPAGVTATFLTNPTTSTSTVTFTASSTTPVGQSTVTITGTSGALTASTSITLNVMAPTFVLSSGGSVTVGQGSSGSSYIYVTDEYGFTGNVVFSISGLPSGVTALLGANPSTSNSPLYLYATNSVTPGLYPLTITGTSGSLTQTTTLNLTVAAPTFTLSSSGYVTMGTGTTVSGWVDINRQYGFPGSVTLLVSGMPSGVTVSFSPNTLTGTAYNSSMTIHADASTAPGQYPLTITGVSGGQTVTTSLTLSVNAPTFTLSSNSLTVGQGLSGTTYVYLNQLYGFSGAVTLSASGLPSGVTATFSPNPTTGYSTQVTINVSSGVAVGQYPITITGTSGSLTQTTTMTLFVGVPSFSLSAYQLTVGQGQTSNTAVYINEVNGFNSPVTLSVSGLPSGVTAAFSPNPTTSYYNQLTFTVNSSVAAGQYPLTITGVSGSLIQTTALTLTVGVPSFTLYAGYASTVGQGSTGTGYVSIQPQNGFNGNVSLSISGLPSGVTATFAPNPTTYSSTVQFAAASTAAVATSTLTITGTYGSQVQTTTMSLTVAAPTFNLYGPYGISLNQGASATSSVTVNPQYGFTGTVNLSVSGLPSGVTASFSPNPATGSSTVTFMAASTASPGTTTFTITGTSGSITNSITGQIVVNMGGFSLAAAPNRVFVARGGANKSTISVVPVNGFASGVNLTVSGLPSGVAAAFSPATTTSSSTLTLTADSSATVGSSPVTITGTSGSVTNSTLLQLTVTNGGAVAASTTLAFAANGNAVSTVAQGTMVTATVTVSAGANPVTAGQVYLCDAGISYCDSVQQIATAQLNNDGNAVFRFMPRAVVRAYKAIFAGTTGVLTSSSAATPLTLTSSLPTTTVLTQSGTTGNYTLTATVTAQGPVAPTGTVSFKNSASSSLLTSAAVGSSSPKLTQAITQTIPVGSGAAFTASGDFNGDGIPDLAVSNATSTTVSILLGGNRGTFTAGTPLQIGASPSWIGVGDFNRDGKVDLAVVVSANSAVAIYLGNGDGTFTASTTPVFTLPQPSGILVGDINGDGFQDLVVPSQSGYVTVQLGHGDGTFTPSVFGSSVGGNLVSVVQADFNGDGVPDLALANESYPGGLTILLGSGDGSFTVAPAISSTTPQYAIAVGDFNHDGKPDLAAGSNGALAVYLGNGDGTFTQAPNALSTGYIFSLAVADIDNDGNLDLIASDVNSYKVITLLGKGDGTFSSAAAVPVSGQPEGLIVGDWNGDGVLDIGVTNYYNNSVTILTSQLAQTVTAIASNVSPNQPGPNTIQANYQGDNSYTGSTSGTVTLMGNKVTPAVRLMPSPSAISVSTPLTVSVQVAYPGSTVPSGNVVLTSGSFTSGVATLVAGGGTLTVPPGALIVGTDTLTVTYTPDSAGAALYNTSTGTSTVSVSQGIPTITWATPASISYGTALSATQLNATASIAGTFTYSFAAGTILHSGQHALSVTFTPTDRENYQSATSSVVLNVEQVRLSLSANNVSRVYGTANPPFAGSVTGAVNGDTFIETFATTATNSSQVGTYAIVPSVSGADLADYTVTMTNGILTIQPTPTTITWKTPGSIAYGTALSGTQLNATSSTAGTFSYTPAAGSVLQAGQNTLSVTFTPTDSTNYQSATGSVLLTVNKVPLSIGANDVSRAYGAANPTLSGSIRGAINGDTFTETFSTSATNTSPVGAYAIVPSVTGASLADYAVAVTNGTLTILPSSSPIAWASPASILYGTALSGAQLNATSAAAGTFSYSPAPGMVLQPGQHALSVTFTPADTTDYQSATSSVLLTVNKAPLSISANNISRVYGTANPTFSGALTGAVNGDTFTETFSTSATTLSQGGTYAIVPSVSGTDLADYTVAATNGILTILPAPTTTTFALSNQNLTVTATVSSTSPGVPTGQVMFYAGQTLLGTGTLSGGTASIPLTSFPSGDVSLSAQYGGDGNFLASTSASVPVLTLTAGSSTLTVTSSGIVTDNFSIGVPSGYSGTLQLSCSGLPQNTSCSFLPASITFSGTATTTNTVLTLTAGGTAQMDLSPLGDTRANAILWGVFALPGLLPLMLTKRRRHIRRLRIMSVLLLLCCTCTWLTGCGGSGGKSTESVTPPGAPSGNYTIHVMASGPAGVSTSTVITLTIQ